MGNWLRGHHRYLILPLLLAVFAIVPMLTMGAYWVQNVGLLSADAMVFASDAPAIDRFMASAMRGVYHERAQVCDGTADQVQIQAAIDSGALDVKLSTGSFHTSTNSGSHLRGETGLKLEGAGIGRTIIYMDGPKYGWGDTWLTMGHSDMEVCGFTLDMGFYADGSRDTVGIYSDTWQQFGSIHDVQFLSPNWYAIYLTNMNDSHIYNCQFIGEDSGTLSPIGMINIKGGGGTYGMNIDNCYFEHFYEFGVLSEAVTDNQQYRISVQHSKFKHSFYVATPLANGVYINWQDSDVSHNWFEDMSGTAVQIKNGGGEFDGKCIVSNNVIRDFGMDGQSPGIYVGDAGHYSDRVIITGNQIRAETDCVSSYCLDVRGVDSPQVTNNTIVGNDRTMHGIHLTGTSDAIVTGNTIDHCLGRGVYLSSATGICARTDISHNHILNCGTGIQTSNDVHNGLQILDNYLYGNSADSAIGGSVIGGVRIDTCNPRIVNDTDNYQLLMGESSTIRTNKGATDNQTYTLPPTLSSGTTFTFTLLTAKVVKIDLPATSGYSITINGAQQADGKYIYASAIGDTVTLVNYFISGEVRWIATDTVGTWSVET